MKISFFRHFYTEKIEIFTNIDFFLDFHVEKVQFFVKIAFFPFKKFDRL